LFAGRPDRVFVRSLPDPSWRRRLTEPVKATQEAGTHACHLGWWSTNAAAVASAILGPTVIKLDVEGFVGRWAAKNTQGLTLATNTADVVRAATTVGGPVGGTSWHRSLRRVAIASEVLAALVGAGHAAPLLTSSLYRDLETTEKSGVSYRLGMAFAAIASEHVLDVALLEHLNRTNSTLAPGSQRRADLYGMDPAGKTHVVEAKSRTYGFTSGDVRYAKSQSLNVNIVQRRGRSLRPSTRAASLADLSTTPISVLLADPAGEAEGEVTYVVDLDRLIQVHYSVVPDLIEVHGGPQPPPAANVARDVVGAFLPGTDIWLGIDAALLEPTLASWRAYFRDHQPTQSDADEDDERVSYGRDGHILQVGAELAQTYEWSEPDADHGQD
jgi:hypothetical protein